MKRQIKDAIFGHLASVTKALASPKRLEIIELLSQGEKSVETIAEQAALGVKNASAQLKELKSAHLVESRRDGKYVFYRLADTEVAHFWSKLRSFSHDRIAEIQRITNEAMAVPEVLEEVSRKELLQRAKKGDVVLIDVRPEDEYQAGHLPFAISIPISELSKHLKTLPKKKEIVAYCRGPYCFFAKDAVETLLKSGFKARRLSDGVHDWSSRGLPVERSAESR